MRIEINKVKRLEDESLRAFYLDWANNFLTVAYMAEYYGIAPRTAENYIQLGREAHENYCLKVRNTMT